MRSRVILVSGANGGLGQAIARAFLAESPENVLWLGVRAGRTQAEMAARESPGLCQVVDLDVTSAAAWQKAVQLILAAHQRLDVLVNNAGKHRDGLLAQLPFSAWKEVLAANLDAACHGCQAVLPAMI